MTDNWPAKRILHVATRFLRGGAERNIDHLIGWERAAGFDVELAVGPDAETSAFPAGIRIVTIGDLVRPVHPWRDMRAAAALRALIRDGHYDIVHTHLSKAGILGRFAAAGIVPQVVHTVHMASFGQGYGRAASEIFRQAERAASRTTDLVVFVGEELRSSYVAAGAASWRRSMVVRSPIDVSRFLETRSWSPAQRRESRKRFGIPDDGFLIASVGVIEPRKRHGLILMQLRPLLSSGIARLAIAGGGNGRAILDAAQRLGIDGRTHVLGHVDDVPSLMAASDLLVHAASAEGVPQVVVQGLAAGRPVVATRVMGLRECTGAIEISASGAEMARVVTSTLTANRRSVSAALFSQWMPASVTDAIARMHRHLAADERFMRQANKAGRVR